MFVSKCLDLFKDICLWPLGLNSKRSCQWHKSSYLFRTDFLLLQIPFLSHSWLWPTACNTYWHCSSLMCYSFLFFLWCSYGLGPDTLACTHMKNCGKCIELISLLPKQHVNRKPTTALTGTPGNGWRLNLQEKELTYSFTRLLPVTTVSECMDPLKKGCTQLFLTLWRSRARLN